MKNHKIKYPKLLLLIITILIAAAIFYENKKYSPFHDFVLSLGYIGTLLGGIFYVYGFTAAPATVILLILAKEQNLILATLFAAFGALFSDFLIFKFIRHSFIDEIDKLKKEKILKETDEKGKILFGKYYKYILPLLAGFLIASPLPTEIGIIMLASIKNLSLNRFLIISFILHSLGIFIILSIGHLI